MTKKKTEHYVNNKEFSQAVFEYVKYCNEVMEQGNDRPVIPNYIAESFLKICEGFSRKGNFSQYPFREEMVMDAVENCLKAINNFDISKPTRTGLPNAFAYFTQITYYAFLRKIAKEKRQVEIKEKYINSADITQFLTEDDNSHGDFIDEYKNYNNKIFNDVGAFSSQYEEEKSK